MVFNYAFLIRMKDILKRVSLKRLLTNAKLVLKVIEGRIMEGINCYLNLKKNADQTLSAQFKWLLKISKKC